jgi:hypothetical protein
MFVWSTVIWQVYLPTYFGKWGWITGQDHFGHTEDVPNAGFSWSPSESEDTWDWGTVEAPVGNISYLDGEPVGSADPPTSTTVSYTATSNVDQAVATANYDITYHDQFEEVSDTVTTATATGPLFGSDPTNGGDGLDIVIGPAIAGMQAVTQGTSSSQGQGLEGGLSAEWLGIFGIDFDATKTFNVETVSSATSTLPFDVAQGSYTYPEFVDAYNRHTVLYRQWGASGEITVNSTGADAPGTDVFDQYCGSCITWCQPVLASVPFPVQTTTPAPVVPTGQ